MYKLNVSPDHLHHIIDSRIELSLKEIKQDIETLKLILKAMNKKMIKDKNN